MVPGKLKLSKRYIQDRLRSCLKFLLTHVKSKPSLEPEVLPSPEGNPMITGPAPNAEQTLNEPLSPRSPVSTFPARTSSPMLFPHNPPALERIRQILYTAIGDVLAGNAALGRLLKLDPPRACFASLALAILEVGTRASQPDGSIDGGFGLQMTPKECPDPLRPLMIELAVIGQHARKILEWDTEVAIEAVQKSDRDLPVPQLEYLKRLLQESMGCGRGRTGPHGGHGHPVWRESVEKRTVSFSYRINALALNFSKVKTFRERQTEVFGVLSALCGSRSNDDDDENDNDAKG